MTDSETAFPVLPVGLWQDKFSVGVTKRMNEEFPTGLLELSRKTHHMTEVLI